MSELALLGGKPAVSAQLIPYKTIGDKERLYIKDVLDSDCLSAYIGAWGEAFNGGPTVNRFERAWEKSFGIKHAVAVNSATSGLFAAMGAIGVSPGDEVIVPPYTMSATAMAPLVYGGIPVFCDIEEDTFCLDIEKVKAEINPKTKAILAVNLFGHPARLKELRELADKHGIYLIEDNAQAPFATENGVYSGTIGHISIFSLNYHKHIHTGEGGICATNDDTLALKLQLIRNHAENAAIPAGLDDLTNMVGFNYRMTEISAAIGLAQLEEADRHLNPRIHLANSLTSVASKLTGLVPPMVRKDCKHVYYLWAFKHDNSTGVSRKMISDALSAEGFVNYVGYVKPLYLLPLFEQNVAFGKNGYPFNLTNRKYKQGMNPVVERMHFEELLWYPICMYQISKELEEQLCNALEKVYKNIDHLRKAESSSKLEAVFPSGNRR